MQVGRHYQIASGDLGDSLAVQHSGGVSRAAEGVIPARCDRRDGVTLGVARLQYRRRQPFLPDDHDVHASSSPK